MELSWELHDSFMPPGTPNEKPIPNNPIPHGTSIYNKGNSCKISIIQNFSVVFDAIARGASASLLTPHRYALLSDMNVNN